MRACSATCRALNAAINHVHLVYEAVGCASGVIESLAGKEIDW